MPTIDLSLAVGGTTIPIDYGYSLLSPTRVVPQLHGDRRSASTRSGGSGGAGRLRSSPNHACAPHADRRDSDVPGPGGHRGRPRWFAADDRRSAGHSRPGGRTQIEEAIRVEPLRPSAELSSRLVTIGQISEPADFEESLRRQLVGLGVAAEPNFLPSADPLGRGGPRAPNPADQGAKDRRLPGPHLGADGRGIADRAARRDRQQKTHGMWIVCSRPFATGDGTRFSHGGGALSDDDERHLAREIEAEVGGPAPGDLAHRPHGVRPPCRRCASSARIGSRLRSPESWLRFFGIPEAEFARFVATSASRRRPTTGARPMTASRAWWARAANRSCATSTSAASCWPISSPIVTPDLAERCGFDETVLLAAVIGHHVKAGTEGRPSRRWLDGEGMKDSLRFCCDHDGLQDDLADDPG